MKDTTYKKIKEIGLDKNFVSALIKTIVWGISWMVGVLLPFQQGCDTSFDSIQVMFGSTCLVFCLSLLVEFLPRTFKKFEVCSKCYYALFCLNLAWMVCISFYALLKDNIGKACLVALFIGTIVALVMIIIGFIISAICYLGLIYPKEDDAGGESSMSDGRSLKMIFEQTLISGALGTASEAIEGGNND